MIVHQFATERQYSVMSEKALSPAHTTLYSLQFGLQHVLQGRYTISCPHKLSSQLAYVDSILIHMYTICSRAYDCNIHDYIVRSKDNPRYRERFLLTRGFCLCISAQYTP